MRFYFTNDSYPELRAVESVWERHVTWWRAFGSSLRDRRLWLFLAAILAIYLVWFVVTLALGPTMIVGGVKVDPWKEPLQIVLFWLAVALATVLSLTWGGEIMRPHLRRVNEKCRDACPECGHRMTGHLPPATTAVAPSDPAAAANARAVSPTFQCPECGTWLDPRPFHEPFFIHARPASANHPGSADVQ